MTMKSPRNPNRRPTHPGAILRDDVLPALEVKFDGAHAAVVGYQDYH